MTAAVDSKEERKMHDNASFSNGACQGSVDRLTRSKFDPSRRIVLKPYARKEQKQQLKEKRKKKKRDNV